MNLLKTIRAIEATAGAQPPVRSIVRNDVFRLNALPDARYSVFAWLQGEHRVEVDADLQFFSFTFFYVDRLTFGNGNEVEVQSTGIEVLENILNGLAKYGIFAQEHTFRTFNQRFSDLCAGVFCNVTLEVAKDLICEEEFGDLTDIKIY